MARKKKREPGNDPGSDKHKHKPKKKKPPAPAPAPAPPGDTTTQLKEKSTQSGPASMDATPSSMAEAQATDAAVYSTGPGSVVAYDYQRTGLYADEYNQQQAVQIPQATPTMTTNATSAAMGGQ